MQYPLKLPILGNSDFEDPPSDFVDLTVSIPQGSHSITNFPLDLYFFFILVLQQVETIGTSTFWVPEPRCYINNITPTLRDRGKLVEAERL